MVSNAPFFSGKSFALGRSVPFWGILLVVAVFVFVSRSSGGVVRPVRAVRPVGLDHLGAALEPRASLAAGTARAGSTSLLDAIENPPLGGFSWPSIQRHMNLSSSYIGSGPGWKCVTPEPSRPMYTHQRIPDVFPCDRTRPLRASRPGLLHRSAAQHLVHPAVGADIGAPGVLAHGLLRPDDTPAAVGLRAFEVGRPNWACTSASGVPGATWARLAQADRASRAPRQGDAGRFVMKCHILLPSKAEGRPWGASRPPCPPGRRRRHWRPRRGPWAAASR